MSISITHIIRAVVVLAVVLGFGYVAATVSASTVDANPTTASFTLLKYVIGDEQPDGEHSAIPEFTFHLDGPIDISMKSGQTVELPVGTYTLTETGPSGYTLDKWDGSCNPVGEPNDESSTTFTINENDLDESFGCQVYNMAGGDGGGTTTPQNGSLTVTKVVVNDNGGTALADDFFFRVNGGDPIAFEEDGTNVLSLPAGSYTVTEVSAAGYSTTYQGCTNVTLASSGTATCTITNNDFEDEGGGGTTTVMYKIEGYVWNDANSNDEWEQDDVETEEVEGTEQELAGWSVTISNGETSQSTVTNEDGYYSFMVPAGTWTISETVQSQWSQTFPNSGTHTVTVPAVMARAPSFLAWLIPTAHAQAPAVFGPFNFGNVFVGAPSGGGSSSGGGGNGKKISLSSNGSSSSNADDDTPQGEVAGAVAPVGAPNTGMGGAAQSSTFGVLLALLGLLFGALGVRRTV